MYCILLWTARLPNWCMYSLFFLLYNVKVHSSSQVTMTSLRLRLTDISETLSESWPRSLWNRQVDRNCNFLTWWIWCNIRSKEKNAVLTQGMISIRKSWAVRASIKWFIEDQAFSLSYDLAPHPPPATSPGSKLSLFLSLPMCRRSSLLTGRGRGRGRSQIIPRREAWSPIDHALLSGQSVRYRTYQYAKIVLSVRLRYMYNVEDISGYNIHIFLSKY